MLQTILTYCRSTKAAPPPSVTFFLIGSHLQKDARLPRYYCRGPPHLVVPAPPLVPQHYVLRLLLSSRTQHPSKERTWSTQPCVTLAVLVDPYVLFSVHHLASTTTFLLFSGNSLRPDTGLQAKTFFFSHTTFVKSLIIWPAFKSAFVIASFLSCP